MSRVVNVRCLVSSYEPDQSEWAEYSNEAVYTVLIGADGPIWTPVPDLEGDGRTGETWDMNAYVTSSGGNLTGWTVDAPAAVTINQSGILSLSSGGANLFDVTVFVTDDNGTTSSNEFEVERKNIPVITQQPSDTTVTEPAGTTFSVEATPPRAGIPLFPIWQAHDGDGSWGPAGDVLNVDSDSETTFDLIVLDTELDQSGSNVRCAVRAYQADNEYREDSDAAELTVQEDIPVPDDITRFDDIPDLYAYWSIFESPLTIASEDQVDIFHNAYGGIERDLDSETAWKAQMVPLPGSGILSANMHLAFNQIGYTLRNEDAQTFPDGLTIISVSQRGSLNQGAYEFEVTSGDFSSYAWLGQDNDFDYNAFIGNILASTDQGVAIVPQMKAMSISADGESTVVYIDGEATNWSNHNPIGNLNRFT